MDFLVDDACFDSKSEIEKTDEFIVVHQHNLDLVNKGGVNSFLS